MKKFNSVGILGGGESGRGAAMLSSFLNYKTFLSEYSLLSIGAKVELEVHNILFEEGGHTLELLSSCDVIVKSPGIPPNAPIIEKLKEKGKRIVGEIEFAYLHCDGFIIAITGSNGKTTTTNLIHHILNFNGFNVSKGGNLGKSFSRLLLKPTEYYVIEVSSYQLEDIEAFMADRSVILNITTDHLDRYHTVKNYFKAKCRIFKNYESDSLLFIPPDDRIFDRISDNISLSFQIVDGSSGYDISDNMYLLGEHNNYNFHFALSVCRSLGLSDQEVLNSVPTFVNDDHRLQPVAVINQVKYINDSKATNIDAVKFALSAFEDPIIWIVGGQDKGNDYSILKELVVENVREIVALGKDNQKIIASFDDLNIPVHDTHTMKDCISKCYEIGKPGDVCLLSPACASFDLFNNYQHRGEEYINEIFNIISFKST